MDITKDNILSNNNFDNYFSAIVNSSNDAIIGKNLDGIILFWNKSAEIIYGYLANEILGKSIKILIPAGNEEEIDRILEKIKKGEKIENFETVRKTKDGKFIQVSLSVSPVLDSNQAIIGAASIARDISRLKVVEHLLQERVKELRAFYALSELLEKPDITLDIIFSELVNILPQSWQYPDITSCKISINNKAYASANFKQTPWMQSASINLHDATIGKIEICYKENKPQLDEGPFMKEERKLLDSLAERLGKVIERIEKTNELKKMNEMMINRELKMMELKKENEQLKKQLHKQ